MRSVVIIILLFLFYTNSLFAQLNCDCDTINKKYSYTGFCNEFLDYKLNFVNKDKAQFRNYVYYTKGRKLYFYSVLYRWSKKQKNFLNGNLIIQTDSILLLNGILETYRKNGTLEGCYYFQNGKIVKEINKFWGVFRSKKYNGNKIREILEYDYSSGFIQRHYIAYKTDNSMKFNLIGKRDKNGNWYDFSTKELINDEIWSFNDSAFK